MTKVPSPSVLIPATGEALAEVLDGVPDVTPAIQAAASHAERTPSLLSRWRDLSMSPWMRPFTEWRVYWKWHVRGRLIPARLRSSSSAS